jgi:hypothetical protein
MRAPHQTSEGFQVGVSKTFQVDVGTLFQAFADSRRRSRWLERGTLKVRTAQEGKSARFDFRDGSSRVIAGFTAKGPAKSTIGLSHERLPNAEAVQEMRAFWKERLAHLAEILGS